MNGNCGMCAFYKPDKRPDYADKAGTCHRYPPTLGWECYGLDRGNWSQQWPWMEKDEVCGEFKLQQNR